MIFHEMEKIGCGHIFDIRMKVLTVKRRRRHGKGGTKHIEITDPGFPAGMLNLILMDLYDFSKSQKKQAFTHFASSSKAFA